MWPTRLVPQQQHAATLVQVDAIHLQVMWPTRLVEDTNTLVQVDATLLQVIWPTRLVFGSHQQVCHLLEAVSAGSNVVSCGSFQQAPLGRVYLIKVNAAPLVQRIEPDT